MTTQDPSSSQLRPNEGSGRSARRTSLALIAASVLLVSAAVVAKPKVGDLLTVRVLRAKVMKKPKFIGSVSGKVSRGSNLELVKIKGQWYRVKGAADGWIHRGQVIEGKVELTSQEGESGSSASREEVELAGRGFTPQVEDNYKERNPKLDFSHVDSIEKAEADTEDIEQFVADGRLTAGAQQ